MAQIHKIALIKLLAIFLLFKTHSAKQAQSFAVQPRDIKVNLGSTALLSCSVSARHGDVQWIHEGTALGYDRKIPGKPRYSVIWHQNEDTEYHLQISNVTLEDEGVFSCQVAPIGDWDTKLEARAKLTVLVEPQSGPELMFNDESKNQNDVVHFKSASQKATKFTCTIRRAKPAASIKWYINGTLASLRVGKTVETKQSDGVLEDLTSVFELKQQTDLIYNNSIIKCQGYHEAYGLATQLANMSLSLKVVVVYPPSVPKISGYDNTTGVIAGTELRILCLSSYSYPPAQLSWYRDGKLASSNYDTIDATKMTESVYQIAKVSPTDHQSVLKCNAFNQAMDEPYTTGVLLNVLYGPDKLTMNGVFEVEAGKEISANCFTDLSNPAPKLRFNFDGIDYEPSFFTTKSPNGTGAFSASGNFSQVMRKENNNKELRCFVENKAANVQQMITKQIKVLFPPDSIEMIQSVENKTFNAGTKIRIECVSRGGNPLPEIEWTLGGKKLTPVSTKSVIYTVESTLDLILEREHHGKAVECRSVNKVGSIKKQVTVHVSYLPSNVVLSLVNPIDKANNSFSIKAGDRAIFKCQSPNSNPQPYITWFKDGFPVLIGSEEQQNLTSSFGNNNEYDTISFMSFIATSSDHLKEIRCDIRVRDIPRTSHGSLKLQVKFPPEIIKYPPSIIYMNENTSFSLNLSSRANPEPTYRCISTNKNSYKVVNSTLNFITSRSDNGDFICSIMNSEGVNNIKFSLIVKYAPTAKISSPLHMTSLGSKISLNCIGEGNPLHYNNFTWKIGNKPFVTAHSDEYYAFKFIPPNLSVLTINNARDVDDGNISCTVSNGIGKGDVAYTELRVRRPPVVLTDQSVLKVGEDSNMGRSASFKCVIKGYPESTFKWKTPTNSDITNSSKYSIFNSNLHDQIQASVLTVNTITSGDYGTYLCEPRNNQGPTMARAILSGKHQPEPPSDFKVLNITKNSIALGWRNNFDGGDMQKFRIRYRKDTMDPTYKYIETENDASSITIDNLDPATRYIVNIQSLNRFGTEGFLREPLIVQTDFGFNEINQMPIFTGNDFPLTVILVICASGALFMCFNIAFIVYLIKKRKIKGEADSTTDTNETEANTVEMFSPPPPYPDELNYQLDFLGNNFEDENKPFVPQLNPRISSRYFKDLNDRLDYAVEYATPIHQSWQSDQNDLDDDVYLSSLRQLDKNITAAISGVNAGGRSSLSMHPNTIRANYNPAHRLSFVNRPFGMSNTASFHQNLSSLTSSITDNYPDTRGYPFDRLSQTKLVYSNNKLINGPITSTQAYNTINNSYRPNSSCKIYQDLDQDARGKFEELKGHLNTEFKGHLV